MSDTTPGSFREWYDLIGWCLMDCEVNRMRDAYKAGTEAATQAKEAELRINQKRFSPLGFRGIQCCDPVIDGMIGAAIEERDLFKSELAALRNANEELKIQIKELKNNE